MNLSKEQLREMLSEMEKWQKQVNPKLSVNLNPETMTSALMTASEAYEKELKRRKMASFFHVLKEMIESKSVSPTVPKHALFAIMSKPNHMAKIRKGAEMYISDDKISPAMEKFYDEFIQWREGWKCPKEK